MSEATANKGVTRAVLFLAAAVFIVQDRAAAQVSPLADVDAALKRAELSRDDLRIDLADLDLFDRQEPRSPLHASILAKPFNALVLPGFLDESLSIAEASQVASSALANLSRWHGRTVRRDLIGDPLDRARKLAEGPDPVVAAIKRVYTIGGGTFAADAQEKVKTDLAGSPLELQQKIAVLIHVMCDAQEWTSLACEPLSDTQWNELLTTGRGVPEPGLTPISEHRRRLMTAGALNDFDTALVIAAMQDLTFAVADLATLFVVQEEEPLPPQPSQPVVSRPPSGGASRGAGAPIQPREITTVPGRVTPSGGATALPPTGHTPQPGQAGAPGQPRPQPNPAPPGPDNRVSKDPDKNQGAQNSSAPAPPPLYAKDAPKWSIDLMTPLGQISIGAEHKLTDNPLPPFLVIDWAGDDVYATRVAANAAPKQRVSVLIDFGGNDSYVNTDDKLGNFGSGQCGVGMLFDFAGDDTYTITQNGLGHAIFGGGLLYDHAGTDKYTAVERAQGCAFTRGVALLVDRSGKDVYQIFTVGQGYGGPGALGALIDVSGDDAYIANNTDIRFPSPQSAENNISMAQGCGSGVRGDYLEGLSLPGGVGLLYDGGGKDTYTCGVFGQGVGYWFGVGVLYDRNGDDVYQGQWYAQGASAHFAVGLLIDGEGDDTYAASMNVTQGAGHDVGLGMFVDLAGNDRYTAGSLAWGAGNAAGIGIFVDRQGADRYVLDGDAASNLGFVTPDASGSVRKTIPGAGVFLDLGGRDTYPTGRGGDNRVWADKPAIPADVFPGRAHGVDMEAGSYR